MSERGQFRGGRGGVRGGRGGGDRGGRGGAQAGSQQQQERPKKENILNLDKYMDKEIMVKFSGGREGMLGLVALSAQVDRLRRKIVWTRANERSHWYFEGTRSAYEPCIGQRQRNHKRYQSLEPCGLARCTNATTDEDGNTSTRTLGLLVARGTLLVLISPADGSEEIANPFLQAEDE